MTIKAKLFGAALATTLLCGTAMAQTFTTIDNPSDPTFNQLLGINNNGTISGYFGSGAAGHPNKGYTIASPYTTFVNDNSPGSVQTQATGINDANLVSGFWSDTNLGAPLDANFSFVQVPEGSNSVFVNTMSPSVNSAPILDQSLGVNNNDLVVGFYNDASGLAHGYVFNLQTGGYQNVSVKGAMQTATTGISNSNQVCGWFQGKKGVQKAFLMALTNGTAIKFAANGNPTQFLGVNQNGQAVGFYMKAGLPNGLFYSASNGQWVTVNDPNGAMGTTINGINDEGDAVGFYTDSAGNTHGMLVTGLNDAVLKKQH